MLHVVIMAGGAGTRFWPASRRNRPKQLLALAGNRELLRATFERLAPLVPARQVWVVTAAQTAEATRRLLPEVPESNVLAEPTGRNTAVCAGLAAVAVLHVDPEAVCVVLPADHVIGEEARFRSAMEAGADHVAREGGLLTFGIQPTRPETGFGYLELGRECGRRGEWTIFELDGFVEKPNAARAAELLLSGNHLWNAGIFAWRAHDLLDEMRRQLPDLMAGLERIAEGWGSPRIAEVMEQTYPTLPAISVDFGIMEGAGQRWTLPVDFPWSDVGSWSLASEELPVDEAGNALRGRVVAEAASGNVLFSSGPVLAVRGVEGLIVVATPDAVLVIPKEQAQEVKRIVDAVREKGWDDVL